jgi:hypothetical protein
VKRASSRRLHLIPNEPIPRLNGTLSELLYIEDCETDRHKRVVRVQCKCGTQFTARLTDIRCKFTNRCPGCRNANWSEVHKKWRYEVGEIIVRRTGEPTTWTFVKEVSSMCGARVIRVQCQQCGHQQRVDLHQLLTCGGARMCMECGGKSRG